MSDAFENLSHTTRDLTGGGKVFVLDTGATITPEAEAMLQALHSRSIGGIQSHLDVLAEKGSEKFMSTYYVGYGHKSIGDLGTGTIFIEGVSMLAAKAIQDWPLYSGQESSTRYIDFSTQPFANPLGTDEANAILEEWRNFYLRSLEPLKEHLKERFPKGEDEKDTAYEKAIAARAFDTLRGFLPAGATTNLAWHTNLRQAADKLKQLRHHPLEEVREIAEETEAALETHFPSSFGHKRYEGTEEYNKTWMQNDYYFTEDDTPSEVEVIRDGIDRDMLSAYKEALSERPEKTELPFFISDAGTLTLRFLLDFGSYRDLQRHRAIAQRMPLLTTEHGFEPWYLDELPERIRTDAEDTLARQKEAIHKLGASPEVAQYYLPMGYRISNRLTGSLPALVYLVELRGTRFVHPTLRVRAREIGDILKARYSESGLTLHLDKEPDRFDTKRGEQDIVQKD